MNPNVLAEALKLSPSDRLQLIEALWASVFLDASALTFWDPDHSAEEDREITIGRSAQQRILFVAHAPHEDRIRIISARRATSRERRQYEEGVDETTR
jgi:uncharacterized DUF497 family protein